MTRRVTRPEHRDDQGRLVAEVDRAPYDKAAGGLGAIAATLRHLRRETGVLQGARTLLQVNQPDGFDCPGCAWPEPHPRASFEFCENGAKAIAEETTRARATPELFAERSLAELRALSDFELGRLGRLTEPLVRREGDDHYRPIGWDEAFALAGGVLRDVEPERVELYTSGRTSNEAAFLYQLFARELGTNNLPDCSNLCHESSGVGLTETIGVGKGTVALDDFDHADAIFVIGQNPGTNHPRMLSTLREAARRGCRIVSVNPLREPGLVRFSHPQKVGDVLGKGTALADTFLQVRVGGDVALLQGIAREVLEEEERRPGEVLDHAFLDEHTTGFAAYRAHVLAADPDVLAAESGVTRDEIRAAAEIYLRAERVIVCWAMGITQHPNAVANVQEIVNLLLLRGNLGRTGAGACPVRGHSNVQGDRTVGITHAPSPAFLARLGAFFGFAPPPGRGHDVVEAIRAMRDGAADVFLAMGGNFLSASPDTEVTAAALERCRLTVHVSTKLNRSHLHPGRVSLILPCLGRTEVDVQSGGEQLVTVEDSMSMVHASRGHLAPASRALRSEPAIVAGLARAALPDSVVDWEGLVADYDRIRDAIEAVVPGFERYNERVRTERGFRLPNGARDRRWHTEGERARFTLHDVPRLQLPAGKLRMMTIRSHDQYNTTVYGLDDRYRGVRGERRVVFLHPDDVGELGLVDKQVVDLVSEHDGVERRVEGFVVLPFDVPRGCAATYFPEANPLVPLDSTAAGSNTPASKSVVIRIEPA